MFKVKIKTKERLRYLLNGNYHREDGPAVEWYTLAKKVGGPFLNGKAVSSGKEWYKNGKLHRLDGPAMEFEDGSGDWYIDGTYIKEKSVTYFRELFGLG